MSDKTMSREEAEKDLIQNVKNRKDNSMQSGNFSKPISDRQNLGWLFVIFLVFAAPICYQRIIQSLKNEDMTIRVGVYFGRH